MFIPLLLSLVRLKLATLSPRLIRVSLPFYNSIVATLALQSSLPLPPSLSASLFSDLAALAFDFSLCGTKKMLAVFQSNVANGPQELCSPTARPDERKAGVQILESFVSQKPHALRIMLQDAGGMAYTHHKQALLRPRSFASVDGIFCLFQGTLENLATLRQEYGLGKTITDVLLIIEAYRTLRDRGPFPPNKVVADLSGHFVFILYDTTNQNVFVALDSEGKVPFYWGTAADGCLAFSDTPEVLEMGCGKSFAPFPPGCYFSSHMGLQSYEHPLQQLKPVARVDSDGQKLGAEFQVDMGKKDFKKQESMHRVGSETNWAESI